MHHIQFDVLRALALVTVCADIIRALDRDGANHADHLLTAHGMESRTLSTNTGHLGGEASRRVEQILEHHRTQLMRGGTSGHFDRFQIKLTTFTQTLEDHLQQCGYFLRDFTLDRFGRFFSCGDSDSFTGRVRQILSFTSSNC